ncbi:hypothetical protein J4418_03345 [Candidatus Woesearchaeota archaeon]|nr:hypothetical protein [Candidatus Woesearchaeota archaeon]
MKKISVLLMILVMLFVVGCGGKEPIKQGVSPFIGGKMGLTGEFIEGAPPKQVYDQGSSSFAIGLKFENKGEHFVEAGNGYVEILGINSKDFGLSSQAGLKKDIPGIRGSKKNTDGTNLPGDTSFVEFAGLKYMPDLKGNTDFKFRANLCYDYKTQVSSKICVNKNPLGNVGEAICKVTGEKDVENSGGPVHITMLKESPLGENKVQILFEIEHVGDKDDMFYRVGTDCNDAIINPDKYKVFLKVTSDVNGALPRCSGLEQGNSVESEGFVTLFNGQKRAVICTLDLSAVDSVFEELFTVDLSYRYHQFFEKSIEIQDVSAS